MEIPRVLRVEISDEMREALSPLLIDEVTGRKEYGKVTQILRRALKEFIKQEEGGRLVKSKSGGR